MRDRVLEKNIARVEAFVDRWKQLSQSLDRGFRGGDFTAEEEAAFLELKSTIAQEHETLMTLLNAEGMREDKALRLLHSVPSLSSFKELTEGTDKRLAAEWHSTLLSLQALLGRLRGRQIQLAAISSLRVGIKNVFGHPLTILALLIATSYGVYKFVEQWAPRVVDLLEK
jgi:hypothetical protein